VRNNKHSEQQQINLVKTKICAPYEGKNVDCGRVGFDGLGQEIHP
jgi:hypothetical protein